MPNRKKYLHEEDRYRKIFQAVLDKGSKPMSIRELSTAVGYKEGAYSYALRNDVLKLKADGFLIVTPVSHGYSVYEITASALDRLHPTGAKSAGAGGLLRSIEDSMSQLLAKLPGKMPVVQFFKWLKNKDKPISKGKKSEG